MMTLQIRRWSERTRMMVLMLAVVLPAAGLVVAFGYHLRSVQREKAVEAILERDYQHVLAIAEKRIAERAFEMNEAARAKFPDADHPEQLDSFLEAHPDIAHAFLWKSQGKLIFQSQPRRANDPEFREEGRRLASSVQNWFDLGSKEYALKLKKFEASAGRKVFITSNWIAKGDKWQYQSVVLFVPRGSTSDHLALAGFAYDADYLANTFFPQALNTVLPDQDPNDTSHPQTAIMVRTAKDQSPLAASVCWDGGGPEVERSFETVFPGLILGIKLRGTTIESISNKFLRTSYMILGALSLLLAAGVWLTYRNVSRELALAKLKSDFVSNVSHELRTPLALIRLYAETLELGRLPNPMKQHEYHEIIRKESERLTGLINNILDFSRIEAGKKEYTFRQTDVADLVRSTLESYRFEIEQNGFHFEEKIENNLPPLQVDREAIARSLLNLVNNAVKYSDSDRYLGVSLYRHNGSVNLEVVDHGIGIPANEQPKIFDKFYRVCDPLVHNTKGSGLGLSLVRHIVQAHGGEVVVESAPGKGSKFTITLPVLNPAVQQQTQETPA
ncbi:MAG TPA: HAMP domain-containing sensor histidine kinase [Candidatus Binatia bacterium]|nr:HAMP domain-containing sensor histidine kinase [Candidatus Binatia bacterium]